MVIDKAVIQRKTSKKNSSVRPGHFKFLACPFSVNFKIRLASKKECQTFFVHLDRGTENFQVPSRVNLGAFLWLFYPPVDALTLQPYMYAAKPTFIG